MQPLDDDDVDDIIQIVERTKPEACHDLMANLAHRTPEFHMAAISARLHTATKSHPWLNFVGARRLSPTEEYSFQTAPMSQSKRKFDMAETCSYLIELKYQYNGIDLDPIVISMFYTRQAGMTVLFGSTYHVLPVLQARPVTGEKKSVFVKLPMDLFPVYSQTYPVEINGKLVGGNLRYAKVHHFNVPNSKKTLKTGLVHYLLAKYGYSDMCNRYIGFRVTVGKTSEIKKKYSNNDYVIIASCRFMPKTVAKTHWEPNDLAFAIPKEKYTDFVRDIITGVLYITDHFYKTELGSFDSTDFWLDKLAFCILPEDTQAKLAERALKINSHIDSLERLMPSEVQQVLKEEYRDDPKFNNVRNIFDLFAYVIDSYADHLHTANSGAVYEMRLDTVQNLLAPIMHRGTKLIYELVSAETNNGGKPLTQSEVQRILKRELNSRIIFKIRSKNQAIIPATATSACYFPKITSLAATPKIPAPLLNINMSVVGDPMAVSKANIDPRCRLPMYTQVDPVTGVFLPSEELKLWAVAAQDYIDAAKVQAKELDSSLQDVDEIKEFLDEDEESSEDNDPDIEDDE